MYPSSETHIGNIQRDQRGVVPGRLLKQQKVGTHGVHMKWALPWLACHAGTRNFCHALAALVGAVKNITSLHLSPNRPASWAVSRVLSPVS